MSVCIRGGPQKPALAPRTLKIYLYYVNMTLKTITRIGMQRARKVYERVTKRGIGRIKAYQEPRELCKTLDVEEYFRMRRLEWL
jgi:hypothetical protein